jgi:hypothetical protein
MSEKTYAPRFFVATKLKNMVRAIPNIAKARTTTPAGAGLPSVYQNRDDDGMHSFHINDNQQKPFLDCDALFVECEDFVKQSTKLIEAHNNKGKSGLSKFVRAVPMTDQINKWRTKRKESGLSENNDAISSRIEQMEAVLTEISTGSSVSTEALITQSVHLNVRLTSCVEFNRGEVEKAKPLVNEARAYIANLKNTEKSIVSMIDFLEEVEDLKHNEPKAYVPWALRQQMDEEAEAERLEAMKRKDFIELKRSSLERRLAKIRKVFCFYFPCMHCVIRIDSKCVTCCCLFFLVVDWACAKEVHCYRRSSTRAPEQPVALPSLAIGAAQLPSPVSVWRQHPQPHGRRYPYSGYEGSTNCCWCWWRSCRYTAPSAPVSGIQFKLSWHQRGEERRFLELSKPSQEGSCALRWCWCWCAQWGHRCGALALFSGPYQRHRPGNLPGQARAGSVQAHPGGARGGGDPWGPGQHGLARQLLWAQHAGQPEYEWQDRGRRVRQDGRRWSWQCAGQCH